MRIKSKVNVIISDNEAGTDVLFGLNDKLAEVTTDIYDKQVSGKFAIPQGTSENLSIGDIAAVKGLFIKMDGDCQLTFNGGSDQMQVRKPSTSSYAYYYTEADITAVLIEAEADVDLTGIYCMWGDLA